MHERMCAKSRPKNPSEFAHELRATAPQRLRLGTSEPELAALAKCDFVLTELKRQMGRWMLRYLATLEDEVYGAAAELRIYVGQLARGTPSKRALSNLR